MPSDIHIPFLALVVELFDDDSALHLYFSAQQGSLCTNCIAFVLLLFVVVEGSVVAVAVALPWSSEMAISI